MDAGQHVPDGGCNRKARKTTKELVSKKIAQDDRDETSSMYMGKCGIQTMARLLERKELRSPSQNHKNSARSNAAQNRIWTRQKDEISVDGMRGWDSSGPH